MNATISHEPPWMEISLPQFPTLEQNLKVDVVVVGAGLTGLTTAYLLSQEGVAVALIDRGPIAGVDSSHTTAHLTYVTDSRLHELVDKFGREAARSFWEAGAAAIDQIDRTVRDLNLECDFRRVPGYLHQSVRSDSASEVKGLHKDADLARELGFEASFVERVPYANRPGIRFAHQAKFHPRKYFKGLLSAIQNNGGYIFEDTALQKVEEDPMQVVANGRRIRCDYLVIATHNPLMGTQGAATATLFQTKLSLYTSYVLGARLPADSVDEGLYWDTHDPYDYLRIEDCPEGQYAIFGGEDVKTGQEDEPEEVFRRLLTRLNKVLPMATAERRWLGQVVETDDGMPFIGENAPREFIATGFCGNGFTLGTLSAMMARDSFLGRSNPWSSLLQVQRSPFHGGLWRYVKENADYPYYMLRDRIVRGESTVAEVSNGAGAIVRVNGERAAAYRDEHGNMTLLSPTCSHLKCIVRWNDVDRTWDCPCHGSRFKATGEVLSGPAEEPLHLLKASGKTS
jgi:glycine/D-amino acid oxidase-like deaminating enzyme/nitrite reductase/ring-hydroxylating ferredoxin subunit